MNLLFNRSLIRFDVSLFWIIIRHLDHLFFIALCLTFLFNKKELQRFLTVHLFQTFWIKFPHFSQKRNVWKFILYVYNRSMYIKFPLENNLCDMNLRVVPLPKFDRAIFAGSWEPPTLALGCPVSSCHHLWLRGSIQKISDDLVLPILLCLSASF